jgi:hypothetical protein
MIMTLYGNQVKKIKYYDAVNNTCSIQIVGYDRWFHNYSVNSLRADGGIAEIEKEARRNR